MRVDDPGADRVGDMQPEHGEGDEVEERRPHHREVRLQHAGGDDGRDRIGGIVQAVEEIERQRDRDQRDEERKGEVHRRARSGVIDHEALDLVGDILELVDDAFQR